MNLEEPPTPGPASREVDKARDRKQPSDSPVTWSDRYVGLATLLVALCFPAIWVYAGYRGFSFNQSLSFLVDDGWCVKGVESIGSHCFGDYAALDNVLAAGNPWSPELPFPTPYPALAWAPSIIFVLVGRLTDSWVLGRDLFLAVLACSVLTPAIWAARGSFSRRAPLTLLLIGLASAPFLVVLDRGNTVGIVVAPLLGLAISYATGNFRRMMLFIVICALLKPQLILLVLLFLVYKKYRYLLATVAISVATTLAGFAIFPSTFPQNISDWLTVITRYSGYQTLESLFPYNLGVGRALLTILDLLQVRSTFGESARADLAVWLQAHNSLLVILLLAIVTASIMLRKPNSNPIFPLVAVLSIAVMAPGTAFSYYLALFLVPAALVLRDPGVELATLTNRERWVGMLDAPDSGGKRAARFAKWSLVVGLGLLMAPLVVPLPSFLGLPTVVPTPGMVIGLLQVLDGPILLLLLIISVIMTAGRIERGTLRARLTGSATSS